MMKVGQIVMGDERSPRKLLLPTSKIENLWYLGEWGRVNDECVAIVGSRRMSRYGKQVISEVVPKLVLAGYTIVSGLMYGIDQEAHKVALASGGKCIGVLGWGIDYECEEGAKKLSRQIVEGGGLIMSEYAPGSKSQRWMFLARNRIVAALSELVIIVEASEKSGTMSTARWARKFGKKVYAAPGSMFSDTSGGANKLIASSQARLLTMEEVAKWGNSGQTMLTNRNKLSKHCEIETLLRLNGPMSVNELSRQTRRGVGEISAELLQLELGGVVVEERGLWKRV